MGKTQRGGPLQLQDLVREGGVRRIVQASPQEVRQRPRQPALEIVGKDEHVENTRATPDRGFAILKRIPGESHTRRKILLGAVVVRIAECRFHVGIVNEIGNSSVYFGDGRAVFIAQTEIDRQVGKYAVVVLKISLKNGHPHAGRGVGPGEVRSEFVWVRRQNVLNGTKRPTAIDGAAV